MFARVHVTSLIVPRAYTQKDAKETTADDRRRARFVTFILASELLILDLVARNFELHPLQVMPHRTHLQYAFDKVAPVGHKKHYFGGVISFLPPTV